MQKPVQRATWNSARDLWETDQTVLLSEHSAAYSETLPAWGMTRNGALFELLTWEPPTSGPASSSSRTGDELLTTGDLLPTPVAQPSGNTPEEHLRKKPGRVRVTDLAILVENGLLPSGGRMLPTPTTNLGNNGGSQDPEKRRAGGHSVSLQDVAEHVDFGVYAPAIRRWEQVTGHPAPPPTEPTGRDGAQRLSARFAEWMMGLPPGWVTEIPISRTEQLRAIGNGVVPQQAAAALADMLEHFTTN